MLIFFFFNVLLTILDEIGMSSRGELALTPQACLLICNELQITDCPCRCYTQHVTESTVALQLILKFNIIFSVSEVPGLVLIYRR